MKVLCEKKPQNLDELLALKIFPKDLYSFADPILAVFKGGYASYIEGEKQQRKRAKDNKGIVKLLEDAEKMLSDTFTHNIQSKSLDLASNMKPEQIQENDDEMLSRTLEIIRHIHDS